MVYNLLQKADNYLFYLVCYLTQNSFVKIT